jgi:hypothetical protein
MPPCAAAYRAHAAIGSHAQAQYVSPAPSLKFDWHAPLGQHAGLVHSHPSSNAVAGGAAQSRWPGLHAGRHTPLKHIVEDAPVFTH